MQMLDVTASRKGSVGGRNQTASFVTGIEKDAVNHRHLYRHCGVGLLTFRHLR